MRLAAGVQRAASPLAGSSRGVPWLLLLVLFLSSCLFPSPTPVAPTSAPTATVVAAPSPTPTPGPAPDRGTLVYAAAADVAANDPTGGTSPADPLLHTALWGGLVTQDLQGVLRPSLAAGWEQPDARTLRITLRPGATFHNGEPVAGEAIVEYVNKCQSGYSVATPEAPDPLRPAPPRSCRDSLGPIDSVQVQGQSVTISISDRDPDPTWALRQLWPWGGLGVRPPDYERRVGYAAFEQQPVGAGPYRLLRHAPREFVELEAFPAWWGPHTFETPLEAHSIRIVFGATESLRLALLRSGQADVAEDVSPSAAAVLSQQGRVVVDARPNRFVSIAFSTAPERIPGADQPNPLRDLRLRQALSLAIDRDLLRRRFLAGFGTAAAGPWNAPIAGADASGLTPLGYDPARARSLLAELALPERAWDLFAYRASPGAPESAGAVCQMWQAVGFPCRLRLLDTAAMLAAWQDPARAQAYPASLVRLQTDLATDPAGFAWYALRGGGYLSQLSDPEADRLIDSASQAADLAAREDQWRQLYLRLGQQADLVTLYQEPLLVALGPRLAAWPLSPGSAQPWGLWRLHWAP